MPERWLNFSRYVQKKLSYSSTVAASLKLIITILFVISCAGCKELIVHNLSEPELHRILTRLRDVNIDAQRERQPDGTWAVSVETSDTMKALQYLESTHTFHAARDDHAKKSSVLSSREEQRFDFERGLSKEIETTLLSVDGVLDARVHLNLPPVDPLFGQPITKGTASASVLLVIAAPFELDRTQVAQLVSGASGIDLKGVSVLITRQNELQLPNATTPAPQTQNEIRWYSRIVTLIQGDRVLIEVALSLVVLGIWSIYIGGVRFTRGARYARGNLRN